MSIKFNKLDKFEFSNNNILENMSLNLRKQIIKHRALVIYKTINKGMGYSRKNPKYRLNFEKGYDILQYNIVVKDYILRRYKLTKEIELDVLLYLFPFQFFSTEDFMVLPLRTKGYNLKKMVELGYIEIKIKRDYNTGASNIYTLTSYASEVVRNYYQYLSGEKTIKEGFYTNPFLGSESKKIDRDREKLMLKLAKQVKNTPNKFKSY